MTSSPSTPVPPASPASPDIKRLEKKIHAYASLLYKVSKKGTQAHAHRMTEYFANRGKDLLLVETKRVESPSKDPNWKTKVQVAMTAEIQPRIVKAMETADAKVLAVVDRLLDQEMEKIEEYLGTPLP
jgi:uncharacterized protein YaaR (DUF327 family)